MKLKYLLILLLQLLILTNCDLPTEDDNTNSNGGSSSGGESSNGGLSTNPVGYFTGSGNYEQYSNGLNYQNKSATVNVLIKNNKYYVDVTVNNSHAHHFYTTSGSINYEFNQWLTKGTVSLGSNSNSGQFTVYQVNTDGSKTAFSKFVWNCSR